MASLGGAANVNILINAVDNFSGVFKKAKISMASVRKAGIGMAAVGGAIAFGLGKAVQTAIGFESAFTGVRKTVDLTEKGFAELEQKFKDMSTEIPVTFVELSKIGEIAGQLGVEGVDNLAKFTRTVADISATTNLTAEQAATDFARIANVMQEPLENVDRMGAVIVDLGNNFATTEVEISTFAQRIAGAGKIAGFTTDEVFSISAALSSVGVQAEAGGSAMQKALLAITKSVTTSDDKLEIFAKTAGMASIEFQDLWKEDASKAFEKFVLGLGTQGNQAITTLDDVGLGGIRTTRAFLSLANAGDLVSRTFETGTNAWEENIALVEEAEKRYNTLESQLGILKNKFTIIGSEIGDTLTPIIRDDMIPAIDKIINKWKELSPETQELIVKIAAITSAILILGGVIMIAVSVFTVIGAIILGVILIIGGLIAIITKVKNHWAEFAYMFKLVGIAFARDFANIMFFLDKLTIRVFGGIGNFIASIWDGIVTNIAGSVNKIIWIVNQLIKGINAALGRLGINIGEIGNVTFSGAKLPKMDIEAEINRIKVDEFKSMQEFDRQTVAATEEAHNKIIEREFNITVEGDVFTQDGAEFIEKMSFNFQEDLLGKISGVSQQ